LKQAGVKSAKDEEVVKARLVDDDFTALTPEHKLALGLGNLTEDDFGNLTRNRIEKLGLAATLSLNLDRVVGMGNDAHLLAGGMLAVLERPDPATFRWVNRLLAFALQRSHQLDPIMGFAELHRMFDSDLNLEQTSLQSRGFSDVRIAPHLPEDKPGA